MFFFLDCFQSVYPEAGLSLTEQEEEAFIKNELTEYEQKVRIVLMCLNHLFMSR